VAELVGLDNLFVMARRPDVDSVVDDDCQGHRVDTCRTLRIVVKRSEAHNSSATESNK
jgi:hypothetical protein